MGVGQNSLNNVHTFKDINFSQRFPIPVFPHVIFHIEYVVSGHSIL